MLTSLAARITRVPWARKILWKSWYQFIAGRFDHAEWSFMNYGYADLDPAAAGPALDPADEPNRYFIQLYHHVAAPADPAGKDVLEVGSGRGGGASYIARYLKPRSMTGVDFSPKAVALANKRYGGEGLRYVVGDAGNLPFENESFDVVVNVESSHCYPSRPAFFGQVKRVLRPGGRFQFADLFQPPEIAETEKALAELGLEIVEKTIITPNVIAGLEAADERKSEFIGRVMSGGLERLFRVFAGMKGSEVHAAFTNGDLIYVSYSIRKP